MFVMRKIECEVPILAASSSKSISLSRFVYIKIDCPGMLGTHAVHALDASSLDFTH